jgi:hypothetical protein
LVLGVEERMKESLKDRLCLQYDGWSENSMHFLAVIVTWPDDTKISQYEKALLSFSPMEDGSDMSGLAQKEHILWVLEMYGKNMDNVVCVVNDNCSANIRTAKLLKCYMIGCYSHKLILGCNLVLEQYMALLKKLHGLMHSLRKIKMSAWLSRRTHLKPVKPL